MSEAMDPSDLPDIGPLPDDWVPLEQVAVIKCLDEDGGMALCVRLSDGLTAWEVLGMLLTAAEQERNNISQAWDEGL